jgi:hypothetical protein
MKGPAACFKKKMLTLKIEKHEEKNSELVNAIVPYFNLSQ